MFGKDKMHTEKQLKLPKTKQKHTGSTTVDRIQPRSAGFEIQKITISWKMHSILHRNIDSRFN